MIGFNDGIVCILTFSLIQSNENQIKDNQKWGLSALKTGLLPLVKDQGTIYRRVDEQTANLKSNHL